MKVNLSKPNNGAAPAAPAGKNEIIVVDAEDIFVFPGTNAGGIQMQGNFVMQQNARMYKMYSTKSKTEAPVDSEGDEDNLRFKAKFVAQYPGSKTEVKEFVTAWSGRDVIILHKSCMDDFYEVMGTPCAPLQLKANKQDNNDARFWNLTFEPFVNSAFVPKEYRGSLVFAEPFAVTDVTEVPVTIANGTHYLLPALASTADIAFDTMTLEHGSTVTLIGSGGAAPATLSSGTSGPVTVALVAGADWVALKNAVINLEVFVDGATKYLFETSRE